MQRLNPTHRLVGALRLAGDLAAAAAALYGSFLVRMHVPLPFTEQLLPSDRIVSAAAAGAFLVAVVGQITTLYFFGFYDTDEPQPRLEVARRLLPAVGFQGLLLAGFYFLTETLFPRSVLILYVVLDYLLVGAWRAAVDGLRRPLRRRVVLVGGGPAAVEIADKIRQFGFHGLEIVGHVVPPGDPEPPVDDAAVREALGPRLGDLGVIPELVAAGRVDEVILAPSTDDWRTRLIDELAAKRPADADVLLLPGPFESLVGRMRYRWVRDVPLIEVVRNSEWRVNRPLKRTFDLVAGSLLLVLSLPVMAAVAVTVKATSGGPVLYRQTRVGRGRREFVLLKFRTMEVGAEEHTGEVLSRPGDPRLTRFGAALRRYRLDELPQLWNVLNGTMSLVGPRPERPGFVALYLQEVPGYAERFSVTPGLTGLAQINGEYLSSAGNKLRYDLAYVANWSLWLDLSILFQTVKIVLTSRGT